MTQAVDRQKLFQLIKKGKLTKADLSKLGDDDKLFVELLLQLSMDKRNLLIDAPEALIQKAEAIGIQPPLSEKVKSWAAKLVLDTWATPNLIGVRGTATSNERRIRFEFGPCLLDVRAEKQENKWHFVSEISGGEGHTQDFQLQVNGKSIKRNEIGFYEWSSTKAPKNFKIVTDQNEVIQLPEVSWKTNPEK